MITLSDSKKDGNIATAQCYRSVMLRKIFFRGMFKSSLRLRVVDFSGLSFNRRHSFAFN